MLSEYSEPVFGFKELLMRAVDLFVGLGFLYTITIQIVGYFAFTTFSIYNSA